MVRTTAQDSVEQKVLEDIAEHGWHCVHILAEGNEVEYSFTIGLFQTYRHPELIVFGLPREVAHQILAIVADAAKSCTPLDMSQPTDQLLNGYDCCFAEVSPEQYQEYVGLSRWYYRGDGFPLFQLFWPSRAGHFPWHHEASDTFRTAQPVIASSVGRA